MCSRLLADLMARRAPHRLISHAVVCVLWRWSTPWCHVKACAGLVRSRQARLASRPPRRLARGAWLLGLFAPWLAVSFARPGLTRAHDYSGRARLFRSRDPGGAVACVAPQRVCAVCHPIKMCLYKVHSVLPFLVWETLNLVYFGGWFQWSLTC